MAPARQKKAAPTPPADGSTRVRQPLLTKTDWRLLHRLVEPLEAGADRIVKHWKKLQRALGLPPPPGTPDEVIVRRRTGLIYALALICRTGKLDVLVQTASANVATMKPADLHLGSLVGSLAGLVPAIQTEIERHTSLDPGPALVRALNRLLAEVIEEAGRAAFSLREAAAVERALNAERERDLLQLEFYAITDAIPVMILLLDGTGRSLFVNRLSREFFGVDGDGVTPSLLLVDRAHPADVPLLGEAFTKGLRYRRPTSFELRLRSAGGRYEPFWMRAAFPPESPSPARIFVIGMPLADRKRRESRTHEERRLESLASLTGGIAHEFNNLLSNILGRAQYLAELTDGQPQSVAEDLSRIARRGAQLVRRLGMLTAAQPPGELRPEPARAVIGRALEFAHRQVGETVQVQTEFVGRLPRFAVEPNALLTAFVELLTNAREATQGQASVRLKVSHRPSRVPDENGMVVITVRDSGPGIAPNIAGRVFDAFVTTKPPNVAAGLGLTVVQGIARRHGGTAELTGNSPRGATFTLAFPVA